MPRVPVARVDELQPGASMVVPHGRWGVGVFNVDGHLYALANHCPHMGAPVCRGPVTGTILGGASYEGEWARQGEILRCPWHSWEFDISTGVSLTSPNRHIRRYEVSIEHDMIVVELPTGDTDR